MTKTIAIPEPDDETTRADNAAPTEALAAAAPESATAAPAATVSGPPVAGPPVAAPTVRRTLATPAIVGIGVGGVLLAGLLFGGGIAVGIALPVGGHSVVGERGGPGGFPGGERPGVSPRDESDQGTRPTAPDRDTDRQRPTAPNPDDTDTGSQTDTDQG